MFQITYQAAGVSNDAEIRLADAVEVSGHISDTAGPSGTVPRRAPPQQSAGDVLR